MPRNLCGKEGCVRIAQRKGLCFQHANPEQFCCKVKNCNNLVRTRRKLCTDHEAEFRAEVIIDTLLDSKLEKKAKIRKSMRIVVTSPNRNPKATLVPFVPKELVECSVPECRNFSNIGALCYHHANIDNVVCDEDGCIRLGRCHGFCINHRRFCTGCKKKTVPKDKTTCEKCTLVQQQQQSPN